MKSRTSFFNRTVLKKDIFRFAPIWAVYTVILLFSLVTASSQDSSSNVANGLSTFSPAPSIYALICATFLFGDLFKSRMCNALHAMPLRRETFLFTHTLSGLLFALIPNLLYSICMSLIVKDYPALPWLWLAANMGKFIFYFSLAAFCAMCVGNRLGHIAVYFFIPYILVFVYLIYSSIYEPLLYGIRLDGLFVDMLSPNSYFYLLEFFDWQYSGSSYTYNGLDAQSWTYLGLCVLIGIALFFATLSLYRRKDLEKAGNFITFKPLAYPFLLLGSILFGILIPVAGYIIAFIGICMLMERTLKVFHKKNIITFAAFSGALLLTIGLTVLDPLGVQDNIPENEEIQSVAITGPRIGTVTFEDPQRIQVIRDVHAYALENRDFAENYDNELTIKYTLNNGRTVQRIYYLDVGSYEMDALRLSLSSMDVIFGTDDLAAIKKDMRIVTVSDYEYGDYAGLHIYDFEGLLNALAQDAKEGNLAQDDRFHASNEIEHRFDIESFNQETLEFETTIVFVYDDCTHTLAFLDEYQ